MKDDAFFQDRVDDSAISSVKLISISVSDSFSHLVKISGLDPRFDFRHSDLKGVDFSNSDLRGYNFSGSDLSGSFGFNVVFDSTTLLTGANVNASMFSYAVKERSFFSENRGSARLAELLNNDHWGNTIELVIKNTKKRPRDPEVLYVTGKIIINNKNRVVRTSSLLFLKQMLRNGSVHRDFILFLLARMPGRRMVLPCIQVLDVFYSND